MRYEWLDDQIDEIVDRYEQGQSMREIADVFEVSVHPIQTRLHETDTAIRNGGPQYIRLEDCVEEIVDQFVEQNTDLSTIAAQYNTSVAAIQYHLNEAGIECTATKKRIPSVSFSPFQIAAIKGELLGDGCLHRRENGSCFFQLSTTTKAHAILLKEKLPRGLFPESQPNAFTRSNGLGSGEYTCWTVSSRLKTVFERMYDDWYETREKNNRKVVPESFNLDQTALLHWYWGDGSCSIRDRGAPRVSFATHGFPEESVSHLQGELERLGYDNYVVRQKGIQDGSGMFLRMRDYDARTFLEDIRHLNQLPQYDRKFPVPRTQAESSC